MIEEGANALHRAKTRRPPLDVCTEDEFEEDLADFWEGRGEKKYARDVREKRITRSVLSWRYPGYKL